jgi:cytochrome b involved in lipid metabolism
MSPKILLSAVAAGLVLLLSVYLVVSPSLRSEEGATRVSEDGEYENLSEEAYKVADDVPENVRDDSSDSQELEDGAEAAASSPNSSPEPEVAQQGYTKDDVAQHDDAASCWTIVNGSVYDLTTFIEKHPGGERDILRLCGTDGTSAFMGQHGGEARPESTLEGYRIGAFIE